MAVLSGLPESYKTWLTLHLGVCVASGKEFLGKFEIKKKGKVLYLLFEGSSNSIKVRLGKLITEDAPDLAVLPSMGYCFDINDSVPIDDIAFEEVIQKTCVEEKVVLVIIDTYRASYNGDENSSKDTTKFLNKIRTIMQACGCSVWLITHIRKYEKGKINYDDMYNLVRGSSALTGAFDYVYGLEFIENESSPPEEIVLKLHQAKNRDMPKISIVKVSIEQDDISGPMSFSADFMDRELTPKQIKIREELKATLKAHPEGMKHDELIPKKTKSRSSKIIQLKAMLGKEVIRDENQLYRLKGLNRFEVCPLIREGYFQTPL